MAAVSVAAEGSGFTGDALKKMLGYHLSSAEKFPDYLRTLRMLADVEGVRDMLEESRLGATAIPLRSTPSDPTRARDHARLSLRIKATIAGALSPEIRAGIKDDWGCADTLAHLKGRFQPELHGLQVLAQTRMNVLRKHVGQDTIAFEAECDEIRAGTEVFGKAPSPLTT